MVNPEDIKDYISRGGYRSLIKVLQNGDRKAVIDEVMKSGLRGRGGAGFSTGMKWKFVYDRGEEVKYVICNADEGDPGCIHGSFDY